MTKRIAMVVNEAWNMYNFRGGLIKKLMEAGDEVTVIAPKDEFTKKLEDMGVRVIDIHINSKGINPVEDIKLMLEFRRIYKREQFDVTFHYTIKPIIYGTLGAALAGIKSVGVTTGLGYAFINENIVSKIVKYLYKFSLLFTKDVWFLNNQDRKIFLEKKIIPVKKAFVLPGEGIDLEEFKPLVKTRKDGKTVFLMVARALWDKGVREYFEAAKDIKDKNKDVEFWFLGKIGVPNPTAVPKEFVEEYVKSGVINYLGTTDDVAQVVKEADCFVLPSYREGISRVIMEAASMEKPVLATDVPGCSELVDTGVNGFLCEAKNSHSLTEIMEKFLMLTESERVEMGRAGRVKMREEFSLKKVGDTYIEFLKNIKKRSEG